MRTPRPFEKRRGTGTLIGNGWLHESPRNVWPRVLDIRGRSALRKCMLLELPAELQNAPLPLPVSTAGSPRPPRPPVQPAPSPRRNPQRDARMFPAVTLEEVEARRREQPQHVGQRAATKARAATRPPQAERWYEDPVALGTLLILVPPIGLAVLWSSKRYSTDARWALTVTTGLIMCLGAALILALTVMALRS